MTASVPSSASPLVMRDTSDGPGPESEIIRDLVRRGLMVSPVVLLIGLVGWGLDGLASTALAVALVLLNFVVAARLQAWAARISYGMVMGVALFGFMVRLALLSVVVLLVAGAGWIAPLPLGLTLVVGHLGLLLWETRFVSASLAFPGLKPDLIKE